MKSKVAHYVNVRAINKSDSIRQNVPENGYGKIGMLDRIITNVKACIIGQDMQVEQIATVLYKNMRFSQLKSNVILVGNSGNGKTAIMELVAKQLELPYVIEDATRYSKVGYVGASVGDMLNNLYERAGKNLSKAQKGILIIDEGDKKKAQSGYGSDIGGEDVLNSLLTILEGTNIPITNELGETKYIFNTNNLSIVFVGVFPELADIRKKRLKNSSRIGFAVSEQPKMQQEEYTSEDFIKCGFHKEFIGRFDTIVELNELTEKDFSEIISKSKISMLNIYKENLKSLGIEVEVQKGTIEQIAKEAYSYSIGARGIKRVIQKMFQKIMLEILRENKQYEKCIISKETVNDNTCFKLKQKK